MKKSRSNLAVDPSERRIENRKVVYDILEQKAKSPFRKTDEIIDYFREYYEGTRNTIDRKTRFQMWIEFGGKCMWCHKKISFSAATTEHITPLREGGTNDPKNLGIACYECNNKRDTLLTTANGFLQE